MLGDLEFYFDFSSPYGFLATRRIDAIAKEFGRRVQWRPILVGAVFKVTGQTPLVTQTLRGPYHIRDLERTARKLGISFRLPDTFPFASIAAGRAFYWLEKSDTSRAISLAKAIFDSAFIGGKAAVTSDEVAGIGEGIGIDRNQLLSGIGEPEIKERLRHETDLAIERGIFGSPFIFADGEPFWGNDRLDDVREWLRRGGW